MKNLWFIYIAVFLLFSEISLVNLASAAASEPVLLLPESLAAKAEMAANQKTTTIYILEKDLDKATSLLNDSNDDFGRKGWTVFSILTYNVSGDFKGFFITYQKNLVTD